MNVNDPAPGINYIEEGWCNEDAQIILSTPIPVATPKTDAYYITKEANLTNPSGDIIFGVKKLNGNYQYFTQNINKPILVKEIENYDWQDVVLCSVYTLSGEGPYRFDINKPIFEYDTKNIFNFEFVNNNEEQYVKITDAYYFYNGTDLSYEFELSFKSIDIYYKNGNKATLNSNGGTLEVNSKNGEIRIDFLGYTFDEDVLYFGLNNVSIALKSGWYDYSYYYLYASLIRIG